MKTDLNDLTKNCLNLPNKLKIKFYAQIYLSEQ